MAGDDGKILKPVPCLSGELKGDVEALLEHKKSLLLPIASSERDITEFQLLLTGMRSILAGQRTSDSEVIQDLGDRFYLNAVAEIPFDIIQHVCNQFVIKSRFMPKPCELRDGLSEGDRWIIEGAASLHFQRKKQVERLSLLLENIGKTQSNIDDNQTTSHLDEKQAEAFAKITENLAKSLANQHTR
ncbi:MAG: hypothetical protein KBB83_06745 [Alphaproteobacteria bacterium]|nr:hypothetical protein [Alphaproteobacteria bacterium]